jgi:hypothetical protein
MSTSQNLFVSVLGVGGIAKHPIVYLLLRSLMGGAAYLGKPGLGEGVRDRLGEKTKEHLQSSLLAN